MSNGRHPFDEETWNQLPGYFEHLPEPVHIVMWGDETIAGGEKETADLCRLLAERFATLHFHYRPRRANYYFYPVLGFMGSGSDDEAWTDYGVRLIGQPLGYQMTSLISAVQAVAFRGQTLEPRTRILLHKLAADIEIEVLTSAEDEAGALMAKPPLVSPSLTPVFAAFSLWPTAFPRPLLAIRPNTCLTPSSTNVCILMVCSTKRNLPAR